MKVTELEEGMVVAVKTGRRDLKAVVVGSGWKNSRFSYGDCVPTSNPSSIGVAIEDGDGGWYPRAIMAMNIRGPWDEIQEKRRIQAQEAAIILDKRDQVIRELKRIKLQAFENLAALGLIPKAEEFRMLVLHEHEGKQQVTVPLDLFVALSIAATQAQRTGPSLVPIIDLERFQKLVADITPKEPT